ncbi:MAG: HDOD domain-containing protein [Solirubrobacteraceae bacterium]|nr:HDOD domain-containing protein [Solirubrobacteraceae bacterium]
MSSPTVAPSTADVASALDPVPTGAPSPSIPAGAPSRTVPIRPNEQHGRRLTAAFDALDGFPAMGESRVRLVAALDADPIDVAAVVAAIETDLGLGLTVLRTANRMEGRVGRVATIPAAVDALGMASLRTIADRIRTVDFFDRGGVWGREADAYRRHAAAVQSAVHRIAAVTEAVDTDLLVTAALLHDVGRLVLRRAHSGYAQTIMGRDVAPEERLLAERRELGVDHALVGGVLARRWGLPRDLARIVERHHSDDDGRQIGVLRLADMLAHHAHGGEVSPPLLMKAARRVDVDAATLRALLYDQAVGGPKRTRSATPCPLSDREMDVLRRLAAGRVYKQIAGELGLSTSTVRTHLHNMYGKLGARDRAQAVLIAVERGWL